MPEARTTTILTMLPLRPIPAASAVLPGRDPAVDPEQYAELRRVWPQAEELVVPAGHHDVQLTRRRIVEPALVDFLDRLGA